MIRVRQAMVAALKKKGIYSGVVLDAMTAVPRHLFVSEALRYRAYDDVSLPIGYGQTVSKPSVIANMVQALELTGDERVLEIGTGSGYQSAILSLLAGSLTTLERIRELSERARSVLFGLRCSNVRCVHSADFNDAEGEFDAIIVSAGIDVMPQALLAKAAHRGRLVIPVSDGATHKIKKIIVKGPGKFIVHEIGEALFVPYIPAEIA